MAAEWAKSLCEFHSRYPGVSNQEECGYCRAFVAALDAYASQQVEAALERACQAICRRCRSGDTAVFANPFPSVAEAIGWHHIERGGAMRGEDLWSDCDAAAIQALSL